MITKKIYSAEGFDKQATVANAIAEMTVALAAKKEHAKDGRYYSPRHAPTIKRLQRRLRQYRKVAI